MDKVLWIPSKRVFVSGVSKHAAFRGDPYVWMGRSPDVLKAKRFQSPRSLTYALNRISEGHPEILFELEVMDFKIDLLNREEVLDTLPKAKRTKLLQHAAAVDIVRWHNRKR